jgi:ketosteroid isomerase-like protein
VSAEDPRFALVRDAFDSFEARDVEGVAAFLHPEVESRVFPPLLNTGAWQGYAGFVQMTSGWESAFGSIRYDERGMEALDDRHVLVAVHQTATGAGSGVPVELDVFFLIEFEGEQVIRFQIHASRESAVAATSS